MHEHDDFDFEHQPGIPAPLPDGEHVLWQGKPGLREMACHAFHMPKIALYFALIIAIQAFSNMNTTSVTGESALLAGLSLSVLLSLAGLAILGVLAWLTSRVTIYTLTNRRILIRFGIALQMTINLPFAQLCSADMRIGKNGFGDIPLEVKGDQRLSYIVLWPHVRPWHFARPQPMLRGIADVERVAHLIAEVASEAAAIDSAKADNRRQHDHGLSASDIDHTSAVSPVGLTHSSSQPATIHNVRTDQAQTESSLSRAHMPQGVS